MMCLRLILEHPQHISAIINYLFFGESGTHLFLIGRQIDCYIRVDLEEEEKRERKWLLYTWIQHTVTVLWLLGCRFSLILLLGLYKKSINRSAPWAQNLDVPCGPGPAQYLVLLTDLTTVQGKSLTCTVLHITRRRSRKKVRRTKFVLSRIARRYLNFPTIF